MILKVPRKHLPGASSAMTPQMKSLLSLLAIPKHAAEFAMPCGLN